MLDTATATAPQTEIAVKTKDISAQVLAKVTQFQEAGELNLPKDYSVGNAVKSAFLIISEMKNTSNKPILDVVTPASVSQALFNMVVMGLSPMKNQCYFIPYGNELKLSKSYLGNISLAKRYGDLEDITGRAVFEGDDFQFEIDAETGRTKLVKHTQTLVSMGSKKVIGAYAFLTLKNGEKYIHVMSIEQIKDAWNQGATKGKSPAHTNFPDEMAIKTVENRAVKPLIGTSNDSVLGLGNVVDEDDAIDIVAEDVKHEIKTNANKKDIGFKDVEDAKVEEEKPEPVVEEKEELFVNAGPGF